MIETIIIIFIGSFLFIIGFLSFKSIRYHYYIGYAKHIIKTNSFTFYKAFSKISDKKKRNAVYVVYAFCRYADDVIDEHQDLEALKTLKLQLEAFKHHEKPKDKIFKALELIRKDFYQKDYDFKPYFDMIEGQYMDVSIHRYETLDDLLHYCYHVASSVGFMLLPILSQQQSKELDTFALELGYAMQITNILRDIGEDFKKDRIYIPQYFLKKYHIDLEHEMTHGPTESFKKMFDELAIISKNYYSQALKHIDLFSEDVRKPLYYAAILYRAIIDKCIELDYQVLTQKPFLSDEEKMKVIKESTR
jgi:phytoene synthase